MKSFLLAVLLAFSININAQPTDADPALGNIFFTDVTGTTTLNANQLVINVPVLIHLPVYNNSDVNPVPANSTTLRLGLNTHLILDPSYDLSTAPLSNYYTWSVLVGSQTQLIGDPQFGAIPADFIGEAVFRVIPNTLGGPRRITSNYNNVNPTLLFDQVSSNNAPELFYTVIAAPVPVDFTKVTVSRKGCNINVNFSIENEVNVDRYEIETSKNGTDFIKVGEVKSANRNFYMKDFALTDNIKATSIFVRVKSVDLDGSFKYSETRAVSGTCDALLQFNIYPNPVIGKTLALRATSGIFNGKYKLLVVDMSGKLMHKKDIELSNSTQFSFDLGAIASGKYILKLLNQEGTQAGVISFEKL